MRIQLTDTGDFRAIEQFTNPVSGALSTSGTKKLRIVQVVAGGSWKIFDTSQVSGSKFQASGVSAGNADIAMTHKTAGGLNTGMWEADALDAASFTAGSDYAFQFRDDDETVYQSYEVRYKGVGVFSDAIQISASASAADAVEANIAFLDASVAAVKAKTDLIPAGGPAAATAYTATRAGYLDNLNVGGNVASSSEVASIQNNTRAVRVVPPLIERPDSGTVAYRIELLLYDEVGNMEAPDSAPTISVVNQDGTSRDGNLDSTTMANVSAGRYRSTYTVSTGHAIEELVFAFSVVEGGLTRVFANPSLVVDTTAVDFTAADRTKLDTLHDTRLTAARAGYLDNLSVAPPTSAVIADAVWDEAKAGHVAAGSFGEEEQSHATTSEVAAVETDTQDIQGRLPAALVGGKMDSTLSAGERTSVASALMALASAIETGQTFRESMSLVLAAAAGLTSNNGQVIKGVGGGAGKSRIAGTVDVNGDRTAATYDVTA